MHLFISILKLECGRLTAFHALPKYGCVPNPTLQAIAIRISRSRWPLYRAAMAGWLPARNSRGAKSFKSRRHVCHS